MPLKFKARLVDGYCNALLPRITHGIIHRLVANAIDTLGIEGKTVGIASVGCSVCI